MAKKIDKTEVSAQFAEAPVQYSDPPAQYVCIETCFFNRQLIHAGEIVSAMKGIEDSPYFKEV